jgi:uncharacterized protein (TIGR03000 family)
MKESGITRDYQSPPLEKGHNYNYEIRAQWTQDGKTLNQTQKFPIHAGEQVLVAFDKPLPRRRQPSRRQRTKSIRCHTPPNYDGWPQMGRWLVPFICRAKAYRQSRCCIRPGRRCLPRSSRHAIRAEGSVP